MTRHTKKVGITGKYGVRYGRAARKQLLLIETSQRKKYTCPYCAKDKVKRQACGIWTCRACKKTMAGGAFALNTTAATAARASLRRYRSAQEE